MSKLGDVVFCVDCDRVRTAHMDGIAAGSALALDGPPRRMATKRDANGEPLCAACLDARHETRHAAFMMHEERAAIPDWQPAAGTRAEQPERVPRPKSQFIRIVRTRAPVQQAAPAPSKPSKPPRPREARATAVVRSSARSGELERRFVKLVIEVGFLRTQELLDQLAARVRNTRDVRPGRARFSAGGGGSRSPRTRARSASPSRPRHPRPAGR